MSYKTQQLILVAIIMLIICQTSSAASNELPIVIDSNILDHNLPVGIERSIANLQDGNFVAGQEYLILASATIRALGTGAPNYRTATTWLSHGPGTTPNGDTNFVYTIEIQTPANANQSNWVYSTMTKWTVVAGEDVNFIGQCGTTLAVDLNSCIYRNVYIMAIPLTHYNGIDQNEDWWYDENTTVLANMNGNFASNHGASITFTPDGNSDYLVFGSSFNIDDSGAATSEMELFDGTNQLILSQKESQATTDQHTASIVYVLEQPVAASTKFELRFKGSSANDLNASNLFILRLNAFDKHDSNILNASPPIQLDNNTTQIASQSSLALSEAGKVAAFFGFGFETGLGSAQGGNPVQFDLNIDQNIRGRLNSFTGCSNNTATCGLSPHDVGDRYFSTWFDDFNVTDTSDHNYHIGIRGGSAGTSNRNDLNQAVTAIFSNKLANANLFMDINSPGTDDNSTFITNTDYNLQGFIQCKTSHCGMLDTNIQYCSGAGCSSFTTITTTSSDPVYVSTGSMTHTTANVTQNTVARPSWTIKFNTAGTYELRITADGNTSDSNSSSTGARTITVSEQSSGSSGGESSGSGGYRVCQVLYEEDICSEDETCPAEWVEEAQDSDRCCSVKCTSTEPEEPPIEEEPEIEEQTEEVIEIQSIETYTQKFTEFDIQDSLPVIEEIDGKIDEQQKKIASVEEVRAIRLLKVNSITSGTKLIGYRNVFSISVENLQKEGLAGLEVIEDIPKSLIFSAKKISSSDVFTILQDDPIIKFESNTLDGGGKKTFTYAFDTDYLITENQFNEFKAPLILFNISGNNSCLGVFCNDFNPCTGDTCMNGSCSFTQKNNQESCGNNLVCEEGKCVEKSILSVTQSSGSESNETNPLIYLVLGIVLIIAVGITFFKGFYKQKFR